MARVIEIRSYNLKPGAQAAFERLFDEHARPMLERWGVDVVGFGASAHDARSYYLIRSYQSLDERRRSQDAFYGSAEWLEGPREPILACIEDYTSTVLELDEETIAALRKACTRRAPM